MKLQGLSPSHVIPRSAPNSRSLWGLLAIQGVLLPHLPHPAAGETAELEAVPLRAPSPSLFTALYPLLQQVGRSLNLAMQNPQQINIGFGTTTSRSEAWPLRNRNSEGS